MIFAFVVYPRYPEHDDSFRLHDALKYFLRLVLWFGFDKGRDRFKHFFGCLQELAFPRIASTQIVQHLLYVGIHHSLLLFIGAKAALL
jgi:hypothetical protein